MFERFVERRAEEALSDTPVVLIVGPRRAGKTTLVGHLMDRIDRNQYVSARIVTTHLDANDALRMVAAAFGLPIEAKDRASLLRAIEAFLVATEEGGRHALLVVDEAQNLSLPALEELRIGEGHADLVAEGLHKLRLF